MLNIIIFLFLIFIKLNNSYQTNEGYDEIKPGNSQIFFLDYREDYHRAFELNIDEHSKLQINIHSINCYIKIEPIPEAEIIKSTDLNFYSLIANSSTKYLIINPLKDMAEGKPKENYDAKTCPVSINSYYISDGIPKLIINNNEESVFYLAASLYKDIFHVSYDIKKKSKNNFVALHFKFEENQYLINIAYSKNPSNPIIKNITESTFIYLDSNFLSNESTNNDDNGNLFIDIQNESKKNNLIYLKIIEDDTVSLLEENALNFGFITSYTTYQYFYTEVLEGKEGELFLHNKRNYGILHAIIKDKNDIKNNISDLSNYPKGDNPEEELEYDQHYLQLKFNESKSSKCKKGCYLLITYKQIKSEGEFPLVGYEFTILSRTWNQSDYISPIIDIPYNEYIISCFGKESSREHYYSIYVPNDNQTKIIIQLEGDYFEVFYGEGRKKVNTLKEETKKLDKKDYQEMMILENSDLDFDSTERILSFAFKPKEYYTNIIASYYFRVLFTKVGEKEYLPMDSNFDNICLPIIYKYSDCNLILKNTYYESRMNFSITSTNQNEYVKIYVTGITKNNESRIIAEDYFNYVYVYDKNHSDIEYFLIKFDFKNCDMKIIISSFGNRVYEEYPQIYSTQMFYINNFTKIHHFKLKNNFLGYYQYLGGKSGILGDLFSAEDFKGKLISFPVEYGNDLDIEVKTNEFTYYLQLIPNLKIIEIEELKQGKPLIKFTNKTSFPLYYCYKIMDRDNININANIRFNEYNKSLNYNYSIRGYIIDENTINKKTNGEIIEIPSPYEGNYSDAYGIAFLQVNRHTKEDTFFNAQYLLIEIEKNDDSEEKSDLLLFFVETIVKEYDNFNEFFLSPKIYFIDTFDDAEKRIREANRYSIFNPKGDKIKPVIEISSQYNNTIIEFEGVNICDNDTVNLTGFWRFTICENTKETIYFNVKSSGTKTNYMIYYYLNDINDEYKIILDKNYKMDIDDNNEKATNISFRFNGLSVIDSLEIGIEFYIIGTLYNPNDKSFELVNSTCFLHEREQAFVSEKANSIFNNLDKNTKSKEFTLIFKNVPREKNYIYDLRLQVKARAFKEFCKEEYLSFTVKADLTDIKKRDLKWLIWFIPVVAIGIILIIVLVALLTKFLKLKKKNSNLQQDIVSLAFSNDVQKNVLTREKQISKNESDFESTFI